MPERSIIDQLDDAVATLADGRQPDLGNLGSELSALAGVAQELIGLPRETFKTDLKQKLKRSDSMSTQEGPAKKPAKAGYVKDPEMRRKNRHAVTPYITVHQPA